MKKLSCSAMGGGDQCQAVFEARSQEEMLEIGNKHVMESPLHEALRKEMATNSDEDKARWYKEFNKLWEETPEL